jgi:hypothetical protein
MLIRADCVHEIPDGAHVTIQNDQVTGDVTLSGVRVAHYDPCPEAPVVTRPAGGRAPNLSPPPGTPAEGWIEAIDKHVPLGNSDNISYLYGDWRVPPNPSATGGLVYIFNGIAPNNGSWILQPVLQWGYSGNYWTISSWLVSENGQVYHSTPKPVNVGDEIIGYSFIIGESNTDIDWEVYAYDGSNGTSSWMTASTPGPQQWDTAYTGVLEAYNISSCSQFPALALASHTAVRLKVEQNQLVRVYA